MPIDSFPMLYGILDALELDLPIWGLENLDLISVYVCMHDSQSETVHAWE